MIKVDLSIRENTTGHYLKIPVLPATIDYTDGNKQAVSIDVVDLGTVEIPSGSDLDSMTWASFFPARYDASYCTTSSLQTPLAYQKLFRQWKDEDASLQVICPAAGINKTMYISTFAPSLAGFEGDINYTVELRELRTTKPRKVNTNQQTVSKRKQPQDRRAIPVTAKPKTYTVKSGDCLILIAKRLGIKDWRNDLYLPNKSVIGPNPGKIKPGMVLKL